MPWPGRSVYPEIHLSVPGYSLRGRGTVKGEEEQRLREYCTVVGDSPQLTVDT